MSISKFNPGRRGTSEAHVRQITRFSSTEEITFFNLDFLNADSLYEKRVNAIAYAGLAEDEEFSVSNGRTFYRLVLAWDRKENTKIVSLSVQRYLESQFPKARAIISVGNAPERSYANIWIEARQINGKKLRCSFAQWHRLGKSWRRQYDEFYGTNYAEIYSRKVNEKDDNKSSHFKNDDDYWRKWESKIYGVDYDENGNGRNKRSLTVRNCRSEKGERAIAESQRRIVESKRAITESQRRLFEINKTENHL